MGGSGRDGGGGGDGGAGSGGGAQAGSDASRKSDIALLAGAMASHAPPIPSAEQAKISIGKAIDEKAYGKVCDDPKTVEYVAAIEADASLSAGARLVRIQQHPALYKFLVSPATVKERVGSVFVMVYEARATLEIAVENLVSRLGETRLPDLDTVATNAILSLDPAWFASRASYFLLGVYAPPDSRVVQCDSFFGLFPLFAREVACFRLMVPEQTTAHTAGLFQKIIQNCMTRSTGPGMCAAGGRTSLPLRFLPRNISSPLLQAPPYPRGIVILCRGSLRAVCCVPPPV